VDFSSSCCEVGLALDSDPQSERVLCVPHTPPAYTQQSIKFKRLLGSRIEFRSRYPIQRSRNGIPLRRGDLGRDPPAASGSPPRHIESDEPRLSLPLAGARRLTGPLRSNRVTRRVLVQHEHPGSATGRPERTRDPWNRSGNRAIPAWNRRICRKFLHFPCRTGDSVQRRVRERLHPPPSSLRLSRTRGRDFCYSG